MESDDISEELLGYLTDTNFDEVANKGLNDDGQSSDEDNEGANNEVLYYLKPKARLSLLPQLQPRDRECIVILL